ncbi:MAG: hypothetical protein P1T08_09040 [Acidimicrobiia bacterium]|nr:hypothetical protein [Acidimicrobiia bacterium]
MERLRFVNAFSNLVGRWAVYQDAPRDPGSVVELAHARIALDIARLAAADARDGWDNRSQGPVRPPKRTSVSDDDLARLRVQVYPGG